MLNNAIGYMQNYPGVSHHPTEEVIIAKLLVRAPDSRALCTQLSDQHRRFGRSEVTMLHKLRGAQGGDEQACREAKDMGTAYCTEHASHIHNEERELFPQAIRWLDGADWEAVADHSRSMLDPVFARKELKRFDNLHDYLMTPPDESEMAG